MKKITQLIGLKLWLLVALISPAIAQTNNSQINPASETATQPAPIFDPRIEVRYTTEGPGFEPFTSFEGFVPVFQSRGNNLTFLEPKLLIDSDGNLGGNILLGHRLYNQTDNRIYGGYVSYDTRDTGNNVFQQLGVGFESLGANWDVRINAYLPLGDKRQQSSEQTFINHFFQQNTLLLNTNRVRNFEEEVTGFDVEFGGRLLSLGSSSVRGYGGLYYYHARGNEDALGVKTRLAVRFNDLITLNGVLQHDQLFDTRAYVSVGLNFASSGAKRNNVSRNSALARFNESVERQFAIVVDRQTETESSLVTLLNPNNNQPFEFLHVNLGQGSGNGSWENPFGTVQNALNVAQPNQIVYVQSGNNPGIPAFTIPNGVTILSSGPVQRIKTIQQESLQLPGSGSGILPRVTGTVTLGNNNTFSGFEINGVVGAGIRGTNIDNATIRDNIISNATSDPNDFSNLGNGILLTNASGNINITNNTIRNNSANGIAIDNNVGQINLTIRQNTIADNNNGVDLILSDDVRGTATITNNQISSSRNIGIEVDTDNNSQLRLLIDSNRITGSANQGISIFSSAAGGSSQIFANVRFNTLTGNNVNGLATGGFDAQTFDNSTMCLQLRNNTSDNFNLVNNSGTFQVENTLATNTGNVNQSGTTNVMQGTCSF